MVKIENIDDLRISLYKNLRYTPLEHTQAKVFIAECEKVAKRVLLGHLKVHSILAHQDFFNQNQDLINQRVAEDMQFCAEISLLHKIVGFNLHSGVMLIADQKDDAKIEDLDNQIIALNGVIDSENVGAIIRNCSAFEFHSIIVDEKSSSPYLRRSVRTGMGNIIDMKTLHSVNFIDTISKLTNLGYKIISAEINDSSISLYDYTFPEKFVLIFGSEGNGISSEVLNLSDATLHIPIKRSVNSLNVAVSTAIFMNHIRNTVSH